ncbi:MAG: hypothetical protein V4669_13980 [Pseudomonadota bacterium]
MSLTEEQRAQWKETGLFPVEAWSTGPESTPYLCPLPDRALLRELAEGVPAHIQGSGWFATRQRDGFRSVYADNFKGMGRQAIASIPSDRGRYFGTLSDYIAAACPRTVLRLLDRIDELELQLAGKDGA